MRYATARQHLRVYRSSYFGAFVVFLLAGYAVLGRGFAYLGLPPIFIGEIGLLLAIATICYRFHPILLRSPITWLLIFFMSWCALCTLPYIETYGLFALRDGVIWAYAVYSLAVATIVLRFNAIHQVVELYGRSVPYFLVLALVLQIVALIAGNLIPQWPWAPGVSIIQIKPGDLAVHYAGIIVFVTLGLSVTAYRLKWIVLWMLGVGPAVLAGRGSMLTLGVVMLLLTLLRPTRRFSYVIVLLLFSVVVLYVTDFEVDSHSSGRTISIEQFLANLQSLTGVGEGAEHLEGSKRWRQAWWDGIINYTFSGQYFWTGKGFGINLADADGFQASDDGSLRSPHNAHMTILARAGVPGLVLWAGLQLYFGLKLFLNFLADRHAKRDWLANLQLWLLLYWTAFIINGSFDVFLEGPQGGIWFWCVIGFGLAVIVARQEALRTKSDASMKLGPRMRHVGQEIGAIQHVKL